MENNKNIRALLGITQEDLAMLLKVTRSQLAMYELGKRDLPAAAKVQLTAMLQHVQNSASQKTAPEPHVQKHTQLSKQNITELVAINKHNQKILEKKIQKMEQKYATNLSIVKLVRHLEHKNDENTIDDNHLLKSIKAKALKEIDKHGLHVQTHHHIKRATLQEEEKLLEKFLKKLQ